MPTNQPSSAPDDQPSDARDDATAATVLHDEALDHTPGGGGLGGASAAGGTAHGAGGAAPNAPLADAMVAGGGDAEGEARTRTADDAGASERSAP